MMFGQNGQIQAEQPRNLTGIGSMLPWMQQAKAAVEPTPTPYVPPAALPVAPLTNMQAGWQAPQGGLSMADILNGPQFPSGPATGGIPQTGMPAQMPSPTAAPINFNKFGADQMAQIMNPNGGANV